MPKKFKYWKVPVSPHFDNILAIAVDRFTWNSKSDFIRTAVREKLIALGMQEELDNVDQTVTVKKKESK